MKLDQKKAIQIGTVCIFSYVASYYMRNLLSVSTPAMLETGKFTKEFVGTLSSVYFLIYAVGQLINGIIGDIVKPKTMVLTGLFSSGIVSVIFAFTHNSVVQILLFAVMGFALSMLRGPLVKTISENTLPKYARICCVFFSFASFAGPLIASFFSILFDWQMTFVAAGICSILIGPAAYITLTILERKNLISYTVTEKTKSNKNVFSIFKLDKFIFYMFVGALVEISTSSINFWIPTYFTERLSLNADLSKIIFSIMLLIKASTPFIALFVFKLFKERDLKMIKYVFFFAGILFVCMLTATNKYINIILFLLALMSAGSASTLLWSIYIPAQSQSGMVSTINGVLDFSGYVAASAANMVFAFTMDQIGWNGIIIMWAVLMFSGSLAAVIKSIKSRKNTVELSYN